MSIRSLQSCAAQLQISDITYILSIQLIQRLRDELGATVAFENDQNEDEVLDSEDDEEENDLGEGTSKSAILSLLGSSGTKGKKTIFVDTAKEGELSLIYNVL